MKRFTIWSLFCSALLMACSAPETMSELDRVEKAFGDQIGGDVDPLHLWRTAVTLKVNVVSDTPVQIWAMSSGQSEVTLYDMATLEGSGTATLTLPQGIGNDVEVMAVTESQRDNRTINLNGIAEQIIDINFVTSKTRSATDPSLYGNSILQNEYYTELSQERWNEVMTFVSQESVDQSLRGEIVNYELVSRGKFECTFLSGFGTTHQPRILGYYYHSPSTYEDITFVDISETHIYDYLDGKAKVQYQLDNVDVWYDANYDMGDGPDDDSKANIPRRGDDAYSIILVWQKYGARVTKVRGLTFVVDVPEGMHLGFYLKMGELTKPAQLAKITHLGLPANRIPTPYTAYNFSAQIFNDSEGTNKSLHRSWIHELPDRNYTFMGMENVYTGGDLDCNDVAFGVAASGWDMVMPEIIEPDIDHMLGEHITLPWTIGYEDVHRNADYDFNDAVIRLEPDFDNDQIDVQVLAAGSDQKMWLHYDGPNGDINLGEIHQLLDRRINDDATELPFINTKSSLMNYPGVSVGKLPWPKDYTMAKDAERFYIEVKRGTCTDCTDIIKLPSQPGLSPEAVLVAGEWKWPKEGISITETYSVFPDWCADMTRTVFWPWHNYPKNNTFVSNGL